MPVPMSASGVLDREFLEIRAKLLELAASFDRLDRGEGDVDDDPRMTLIREAIEVLSDVRSRGRAENLQLIFSLPYQQQWRDSYGIESKE